MNIKRERLEREWGFIDYHYSINEEYPNGILVFMGSFVYQEHRGKHLFSGMVKDLFEMFPEGTEVQVPVSNKKLNGFFESLGFKKTDKIEYWGSPQNSTLYKGKIKWQKNSIQ